MNSNKFTVVTRIIMRIVENNRQISKNNPNFFREILKRIMGKNWGIMGSSLELMLASSQPNFRNGTKWRKLGLVHTARVLVRMLIPFPRIWGIRNLLYIPATLYRILVRFVKNGRAIILENGVCRVSCCFPRLLLA